MILGAELLGDPRMVDRLPAPTTVADGALRLYGLCLSVGGRMLYLVIIVQMAVSSLILATIGTLIVAPMLKLANRDIPFFGLTKITFWGLLRGAVVIAVIYAIYIVGLGKSRHDVPGLLVLAALGLMGWLIRNDLKMTRHSRQVSGQP